MVVEKTRIFGGYQGIDNVCRHFIDANGCAVFNEVFAEEHAVSRVDLGGRMVLNVFQLLGCGQVAEGAEANELEKQVRLRTAQIERSREQIIHCLARAAEYRDNETGEHVIRVGKYCAVIADELGFGENYCRQIELASQLHDVGKIGIPDSVLLNPGKLSHAEFEVMKKHCHLGCQIMEPLAEQDAARVIQHANVGGFIMDDVDSPMLELAAIIARTHHEKWDGSGYPNGLAGDQIPIEGRICCCADVFDALSSERPYKKKFPLQKCLEIMISERGTRFDPVVLDAFLTRLRDIEAIRLQYNDEASLNEILQRKEDTTSPVL